MMRHNRILVIDDSLTIRAMVEELLGRQGNCRRIAVAPDAATARALITDFKPNLITLDLNMPGMNGLAFLDELRDRHHHAPVVVVSSSTRDGSDATEEAIRHGAKACFDKHKIITNARDFLRVLKKAATRH